METNLDCARAELRRLREDLMALESNAAFDPSSPLRVSFMLMADADSAGCPDGEAVFDSTFGREIAFAAHHAIHHNAYLMLSLGDAVTFPPGFGLAPSTAAHLKANPTTAAAAGQRDDT